MSYSIITTCTGCTACVKVCPVNAISGERKALHTIESVICIDCGACGRICPAKAVLDELGEVCPMVKRSQWLQPVILEAKCVSCGICLEVCPTSVLEYAEVSQQGAHVFPHLMDAKNCIGCSFCGQACPVEAILMQPGQPISQDPAR